MLLPGRDPSEWLPQTCQALPQAQANPLVYPPMEKTPEWISFAYNYCCLVTQSCLTLWNPMDCSPPDSSVYGILQARNTGVGCHALLQAIFPTQGSNPGLLLGRQILYHCATWGAPGLLRPLPHFYSRILASLPEYLLCSSLLCPCPQHSLHPPPSSSHQ